MNNYSILEDKISYKFKNINLLENAFIHSSYVNENDIKRINDNERLEFLGDAVLELIVSNFLYNHFKDMEEGYLTKKRARLVCEDTLSKIAVDLELYNYLKLGKSENADKVKENTSIMCDTFESLLGSIYLDGGYSEAEKFVKIFLLTEENLNLDINNYKSILQELCNVEHKTLKYVVYDEKGPDHKKEFYINVYINDELLGSGMGSSKKDAEQNAAKAALYRIM